MTLEYQEIMDAQSTTYTDPEEIKKRGTAVADQVLNTAEEKEDKVNHPSHYTWLKKLCGIEVIDVTRHMCFNLGNVVKYVLRAGHKSEKGYSNDDKEIEDLRKAKWYLEDEIKLRTGVDTSDQAIIHELELALEVAEKKLLDLAAANAELRRTNRSTRFVLGKGEILKAANIINENDNIQNPIHFSQSSTGIGIGTDMKYTTVFEDKTSNVTTVDITDFDAW